MICFISLDYDIILCLKITFVHYKGWPNTYDEWKTVNEMKHL